MAHRDQDEDLLSDYCPKCGQYTGGDSICPNCGAELFDETGLEEHDEDEEEGGISSGSDEEDEM